MRELIERRKLNSKIFDLGAGQYRIENYRNPIHWVSDGKLLDFDMNGQLEGDQWVTRGGPFVLRIAEEVPAYRYSDRSGKAIEVELQSPDLFGPAVVEDGLYTWIVAQDTLYSLAPVRGGCVALLHLMGPDAPRTWRWRIKGDVSLLKPITGHDARGQHLELSVERQGDDLIVTWTGRVTSGIHLRKSGGKRWSEDVVYPVRIDPTINENVGTSADDVGSGWRISPSVALTYFAAAGGLIGPAFLNLAGTLYRIYAGVRFQTLGIPAGATINSATLTVRTASVVSPNPSRIYGNKVADAAIFSNPGNLVRNMTKTTAFTQISTLTGDADNAFGVTGIMAELCGQGGWASNNDVAFGFFNTRTSGTNIGFSFAAFDHATLTEPRLAVTYTVGGAAARKPAGRGLTKSTLLYPRQLVT